MSIKNIGTDSGVISVNELTSPGTYFIDVLLQDAPAQTLGNIMTISPTGNGCVREWTCIIDGKTTAYRQYYAWGQYYGWERAATNADLSTKQDSLKLPQDTPIDYPKDSGGSGAAKTGGWTTIDGNTAYYNLMMNWALVQFKMQNNGLWIRMYWGNNNPSGWKQLI